MHLPCHPVFPITGSFWCMDFFGNCTLSCSVRLPSKIRSSMAVYCTSQLSSTVHGDRQPGHLAVIWYHCECPEAWWHEDESCAVWCATALFEGILILYYVLGSLRPILLSLPSRPSTSSSFFSFFTTNCYFPQGEKTKQSYVFLSGTNNTFITISSPAAAIFLKIRKRQKCYATFFISSSLA